ncbi:uncharacterized protein K460DRAFT_358920 [Cucurbitaria berberidis CBS 394.84]|uniref:RING-type domain-containing protein n=1 Tax=Cucurbitaria berberidis CBS 394.84 TaxID=1168544 RepID=A0A9P4GBB3_9PLEO|nr:uncharacterized protein K460DRAFT_358920 [Cucurbitaria berberidis CBS 394.84]KAF1842292.1 hypothetical protein K460DRAFT_358920 [Cucurbitaria berberidis CBS 394.84]
MTSTINPRLLTINTALETCRPSPANEKCAICQEMLTDATLEAQPKSESKKDANPGPSQQASASNPTDMEAVKTKVCGDMHFFHRICIISWFTSTVPNLNSCPIDRNLLFGPHLVSQPESNLPTFDPFPGHDVYYHDTDQPARVSWLPNDFAAQSFAVFDNLDHAALLAAETLDHDVLQAAAEEEQAMPGRAVEIVADPEGIESGEPISSDLEEISSDEHGGYLQDAAELADRNARGLGPAPQGRPFEKGDEDADYFINSDLVRYFSH